MPILGGGASVQAGTIQTWPSTTVPAGWIKCNGAAVSRTLYAALFNVIGTTYGAGDGSTTFNLPDWRGEFVRGLDDGRGVDSGRTIGTAQADDFKSHNHNLNWEIAAPGTGGGLAPYRVGGSDGGSNYVAGGTETRPRNVSALYIIKF